MNSASSDPAQGDIAGARNQSSLPVLALSRRDAHFAVMVEGRLPRAGHLPFQVAIPQELHHRLRLETLGSLNQVLVALVRQALAWLDAEQLTLHAEVHPGPVPTSPRATRPTPGPQTEAQRHEEFLVADRRWPNAVLDTRPRNDHWVIVQPERQPRIDAQLTQIALPAEVHQRLLRDGMGAISQLVISLARYALLRLDLGHQTLEVRSAPSVTDPSRHDSAARASSAKAAAIGSDPGMTAGQLIHMLSAYPPETRVMYELSDERWGNIRQATLALMTPKKPHDERISASDSPGGETKAVLLSGYFFDINLVFDGDLFEVSDGEMFVDNAE